ncbi:MAG TPA: ABC transporter permease [Fimbriimonadaceae bacterium]|nr:ABC transporter permease [Fimbriimonadaceae bacterium]
MNWKLAILIVAALGVVIGALIAIGVAPSDAFLQILKGSVGTPGAIGRTLRETTPLLILGVAVFLGLRGGLFNIGVEGQFLIGACVAASLGLKVPGILGVLLAIVGGAIAGALWAFPAGWIKAYRGGHEVISTIMLNNIAFHLTTGLVAGPLKAPGQQSTTTATLTDSTKLPMLYSAPPLTINIALIFALALVAALALWLKRTVAGYELNAVGANPKAAQFAGVDVRKVTVWTMLASGAIGGLAGSCQVLAYEHRFYEGFSPGYGFDALGVALLAGSSPWGVVPAAGLFGILSTGSSFISAALQIPKGLNGVLIGLIIIVFAAFRYRRSRSNG